MLASGMQFVCREIPVRVPDGYSHDELRRFRDASNLPDHLRVEHWGSLYAGSKAIIQCRQRYSLSHGTEAERCQKTTHFLSIETTVALGASKKRIPLSNHCVFFSVSSRAMPMTWYSAMPSSTWRFR